MVQIDDGTWIRRAADQIFCDLGGEMAILNLKTGVYFGLDSTAAAIWTRLESRCSYAELKREMALEFDIDLPTLDRDLIDFLSELRRHGLVEFGTEKE